MLELIGLAKTYKGEPGPALDGIDLRIGRGEFVVVLGRSGAGKSTLLRCINRLVEPDAGTVILNGRSVNEVKAGELRRLRGEIGMVFQHFNLLPGLTVETNVIAGRFARMPRWRSLLGWYTEADRRGARAALREVGLERFARRRADGLSGGQKQRVAIARVLMQEPLLLLGDEPISSLDEVAADRIMRYFARLHRERGLTVLLNLHDVAAARRYAQRIIGIRDGRIVFDGPPDRLDDDAMRLIYPPDVPPDGIMEAKKG